MIAAVTAVTPAGIMMRPGVVFRRFRRARLRIAHTAAHEAELQHRERNDERAKPLELHVAQSIQSRPWRNHRGQLGHGSSQAHLCRADRPSRGRAGGNAPRAV
jgi:hypothetical protein